MAKAKDKGAPFSTDSFPAVRPINWLDLQARSWLDVRVVCWPPRSITGNTHDYAKSLRAEGTLLARYMCTHVPEEILYAAGITESMK